MKHLACIMDGNRRWARSRSLQPWIGHEQGAKSLKTVIKFCLQQKIEHLSLYTFSIENLNRSEIERSYIFNLIANEAKNHLSEFLQNDIKVRFIGENSLFPASVMPTIETLERETSHCMQLNLNFLFCYGSRQEIIGGIKKIIKKVKEGLISENDISENSFSQYLWTGGIPEPDLIIRTGGAVRLSNFFLYQAAYSEFYFLDCLWPDINEEHLYAAFNYFKTCKRNFGS